MENKEVEQALDRLLNDDYNFPHDFYGEDKATACECDVDALISYIEQLEQAVNKLCKTLEDIDGDYEVELCPAVEYDWIPKNYNECACCTHENGSKECWKKWSLQNEK